MRVAVTGSNGRVGQYLVKKGVLPFVADVTDSVDVDREMNRLRPDVLLHLAAKSDVDWCEKKENESKVIEVNLDGTYNVCSIAEKYKVEVVLMSSGYVFSGKRWWGKYKETDWISPCNMYGLSKASSEALQATFTNLKIIRTSYLFDHARLSEDIERLKQGVAWEYPTFLDRSFLYIPHFVDMVMQYCKWIDESPSILHLSGCDTVSWQEFMRDVARAYKLDPKLVRPRRKDLKNGFANRGYRLGLDTGLSALLGYEQKSYRDGLKEMASAS